MNRHLDSQMNAIFSSNSKILTNGISNGRAGVILFFYILWLRKGSNKYFEQVQFHIHKLLDEIGNASTLINYYPSDYSKGLLGVASVLRFIGQNGGLNFRKPQFLNVVDDIIFSDGQKLLDEGKYNFYHGASGAIIYILNNEKLLKRKLYSRFLDKYLLSAVSIDFEEKFKMKNGRVNHSLPYGLTGYLFSLIKILSHNRVEREFETCINNGIKLLIEDTIEGLLNSENNGGLTTSNYSWSRGELPILLLLYYYVSLFENKKISKLISELEKLFMNNLLRLIPIEIKDVSFSHGLAGASSIYSSLYEISGQHTFQEQRRICMSKLNDFELGQQHDYYELIGFGAGMPGYILNQTIEQNKMNTNWKQLFCL